MQLLYLFVHCTHKCLHNHIIHMLFNCFERTIFINHWGARLHINASDINSCPFAFGRSTTVLLKYFLNMNFLHLLTVNVFIVETVAKNAGFNALKCYKCDGDCSRVTQTACYGSDTRTACVKTFVGEHWEELCKKKKLHVVVQLIFAHICRGHQSQNCQRHNLESFLRRRDNLEGLRRCHTVCRPLRRRHQRHLHVHHGSLQLRRQDGDDEDDVLRPETVWARDGRNLHLCPTPVRVRPRTARTLGTDLVLVISSDVGYSWVTPI